MENTLCFVNCDQCLRVAEKIKPLRLREDFYKRGCVEISDKALREKILAQSKLATDEPIRSFCVEAFQLIASISGHPITKINDFFWSIGRSCCHKTTLCMDQFCEKSPCTFAQIVEAGNHKHCIFQDVCKGAVDENYRKLWQPMIETHYY